jgi:hypothetical protein
MEFLASGSESGPQYLQSEQHRHVLFSLGTPKAWLARRPQALELVYVSDEQTAHPLAALAFVLSLASVVVVSLTLRFWASTMEAVLYFLWGTTHDRH